MAKLMVIADGGKQVASIPRGIELAYRLGHSVELVAFVSTSLKAIDGTDKERAQLKQRLLNECEQQMEERARRYQREGQKIRIKVVWTKDVVNWILKRVASGDYAGVVKTGRRTESLVHTPIDWQLLRECPVPVIIVATERWVRAKPVLAAVDLATSNKNKRRLNDKVVAAAKAVAEALGQELKLIAAIEVPTLLADFDLVDPGEYVSKQKVAMADQAAALAKAHGLPKSAFRIKRGPVDKVIYSEAARVRAQLVVMGTVGRRGVRARVLGNTAESVLHMLHTDIMAIKP